MDTKKIHELYGKIVKLYESSRVFRYVVTIITICVALLLVYKLGVVTGKFISNVTG